MALAAGLTPLEIYRPEGTGNEIPTSESFICSEYALTKASYRSNPKAVIGVFAAFSRSLDALILDHPALVVISEDLEKPGNFGAILRTADACGVDALVVTGDLDPFNPNVIRASRGAVFVVPFVVSEIESAIAWARAGGLQIVASSPSEGAKPWETDMTGGTALLVGAEDIGLSPTALDAADVMVSIPMTGSVDSLNVSVSVAMLCYEIGRQRSS